jgi:Short C-terminal domain
MIVRRRVGMPLLRGAIVGGAAYSMGRRAATSAQREQQQSAAIADLQQAEAAQPQPAQVQPVQSQPVQSQPAQAQPQGDVTSRLAQLGELLQQGVLTPDEFAQAKAKVLAGA